MISVEEAGAQLSALVHQAEVGESVTLLRSGQPVAVILGVDALEQVKRDAELHAKSVNFSQRLAEIRLRMAEEDAFADWTDEEIDSWRAHSTGQTHAVRED